MKRRPFASTIAASLIVLASLAASSPTASAQQRPSGPARALPPGTYQLAITGIPDPGGPVSGPMIGARILMPAGWRTQGGAVWERDRSCSEPASFRWTATSPDGRSNFELYQLRHWSSMQLNGKNCPIAPFRSVQDYLTAMVQQNWPGARITGFRQRPDLITPSNQESLRALQSNPNAGRVILDTGEIRYEHTVNGAVYEGVVVLSAYISFGAPVQAYYNGPMVQFVNGQSNGAVAARAPKGQLDLRLVEAMRKSIRVSDAWMQAFVNVQLQDGAVRAEQARQRLAEYQASIARARAAEARSGSANASYASQEGDSSFFSDRAQRERIEAVNGVETYDDPLYGGRVQLDRNYDHAWRVQNSDSYILTNDPNFNPGQFNIDARQLQVTR